MLIHPPFALFYGFISIIPSSAITPLSTSSPSVFLDAIILVVARVVENRSRQKS
jgi:hypothetical protein